MIKKSIAIVTVVICVMAAQSSAVAGDMCATAEQSELIRAFFSEKPGTQPVIASRRLGLAEEIVTSGLPSEQAISASGEAFSEVWKSMSTWKEAVFLITKENNVFEILSGVGKGKPSEVSSYFNIEYKHALRGHLRPDLYSSIYAVAVPDRDGDLSRGIIFYDENGASVFGAFISGDVLSPSEGELEKFDELWTMIGNRPSVCPDV